MKIYLGGLGWPLLAYLCACALSLWHSLDFHFSLRAYWKLLELVAGFIALANLLRRGQRAEIAARAVAYAMLLAVFADAMKLLVDHHFAAYYLTDGRWNGSHYGFPTIAAAVHAAGFVLATALLLRARSLAARAALAGCLVLYGAMLLDFQTRSVFPGIAAGLLVLLVAAARERRRAMIAIGICGAVLAAALFVSPAFRGKVLSGTMSDRGAIWTDAKNAIRNEQASGHIFGYGYGHGIFKRIYDAMPRHTRYAKKPLDHTHNMMLETLVETGWTGLAAWLALVATAIWRFARAMRNARDEQRRTFAALAAALVTLFVYGQFSAFFALAPIFLFWNLLGILAAAETPPSGFQSLEKGAA